MALKGTSQDQSKFCFKFLNIYLQMSSKTIFTIINVIWGWGGIYVPHRFLYLYRGTVSAHHLSQYLYLLDVIWKCKLQLWVILGMSL